MVVETCSMAMEIGPVDSSENGLDGRRGVEREWTPVSLRWFVRNVVREPRSGSDGCAYVHVCVCMYMYVCACTCV